jgi:hypothetical protein
MSENEKKHESQSCCCCQSWKAIFIAIAFMAIGAVLGHVMTMMHHCGKMAMNHPFGQMTAMRHPCCLMMGPRGGGYGREARWDRDDRERECRFEHKFREGKEVGGEQKGWFEHKTGKRAARLSDPNKASCPMMDKKEGKSRKD